MDDIFKIQEAYELLKEEIMLIDKKGATFILKNKKIYVYSLNAAFIIDKKTFFNLYIDDEFMIYKDNSFELDNQRDKEYYSFKHK